MRFSSSHSFTFTFHWLRCSKSLDTNSARDSQSQGEVSGTFASKTSIMTLLKSFVVGPAEKTDHLVFMEQACANGEMETEDTNQRAVSRSCTHGGWIPDDLLVDLATNPLRQSRGESSMAALPRTDNINFLTSPVMSIHQSINCSS